jgi:hypothetical protein
MSKMSLKPWLMAALGTCAAGAALASSHREAPFITTRPKVDASDFYLFNSYEAGRAGYVTLIANYLPLQDPAGGPNFFELEDHALYEISIDNTGSGKEALTFQFRFTTTTQGLAVTAGTKSIPVPLINIAPISATSNAGQNVAQTYTLTLVTGDRRHGTATPIVDASTGSTTFTKPLDNIGNKSIPDYVDYANSFIHTITIPGCSAPGRVFVGQRMDGFVVNLGETFDLVNVKYPVTQLAPPSVNARNFEPNSLANKNVTSLALEVPASCLTSASTPIIGGYTTASLRQADVLNPAPQSAVSVASVGPVTASPTGTELAGGAWVQVSRLGNPLVNELVIGLPDKDRFNSSSPSGDAQFADYVTNPSLPVLLQALFGSAGVVAPNVYPRTDLEAVFLTGVAGLNQPPNPTPSEELRLNTATAVTPIASQNDLGVLGGDTSGFPNGRRPIDDVVDITLRAAMGVLLTPYGGTGDPDPSSDASRQLGYTDGAEPNPANYLPAFPYLAVPIAGSPVSATM